MKAYIYLFISIIFIISCKKEDVLPGNSQQTYVNFYNASEVLQQNGSLSTSNQILINGGLPGNKQPQFSSTDDFRQFPRHVTGTDFVIDVLYPPNDLAYNPVYWMAFIADRYEFTYTSTQNTPVADTAVSLMPKTFTTQYLVEATTADHAYRVISIPVERSGSAQKVRMQIINLSPDFGPLEVYRSDDQGNRIASSLPLAIDRLGYSSYVDVDTIGAAKTFNKILLSFCKSGTDEVVLTKAIPAIPNSNFSIVFQGFEKTTDRRIKTNETEYQSVRVSPNLRVNVRRIF